MTAEAWIVGQDRCRTGKGLFDVDLLTGTQMDIALGVVLKGRVLQGHFGTAKVRQTDAVFSALDGAAVDLCIAEIAVAVNDRGIWIRAGDRTAVHAQAAAVFDGAGCARGNGAAVDFHKTPFVVDAAGTLRRKGSVCCDALVNGQVCRAVDKAAFCAGGLEVAAIDVHRAGTVNDNRFLGGRCNIVQRHVATIKNPKNSSFFCRVFIMYIRTPVNNHPSRT